MAAVVSETRVQAVPAPCAGAAMTAPKAESAFVAQQIWALTHLVPKPHSRKRADSAKKH